MHKFFLIIFTIILGIVSGLVGGGLGLGTTTIALPVFAFLFNNVKTAIGTTLIASPFSWPSVYVYYKEGHADILLGIIYVIFYLIASYFGAEITEHLSFKILNYLISLISFLIALYFLRRGIYSK
jgi:uncharacterized membrane protein YfcA